MKYILRWWRALDRPIFLVTVMLILIGVGVGFSVSNIAAQRFNVSNLHVISRQIAYCMMGISCMICFSGLSSRMLQKYALTGFVISILLTSFASYFGIEVKGSRRWLYILGISIQPSEFLKIAFVVWNSLLLKHYSISRNYKFLFLSFLSFVFAVGIVLVQPDVGNSVLLMLTFLFQIFLSGLPIILIIIFCCIFIALVIFAYLFFPHVALRINNFLTANLSYHST